MQEKVCNQSSWAAGAAHYDEEDFCFTTLRYEAGALAADSSMGDMAATPAAAAESAAVRGGLGINLIATLNGVASPPVITGNTRTPEEIEAGAATATADSGSVSMYSSA